jgi:hypothetical protein
LNTYIKGGIPKLEFGSLNGFDIHVITGTDPATMPSGVAAGSEYIYNKDTGSVWINDTDLFDGKFGT